MTAQEFGEDLLAIIEEKHRRGLIGRRAVLAGIGAATLTGALPARAQAKEIAMVNWGGDNHRWLERVYMKPYEAATGTRFSADTAGPTVGRLRTKLQGGKVDWDVADAVPHTAYQLADLGLMDEIDYGVVDKSKVIPEFVYPHAVANGVFSNVLTFDASKFGGRKPAGWADLWNVKDFPGKRTLWRGFNGVLEIALMADGVPLDKIYPIDVDRAFAKIREIKPHTIFWNSGSESQQMFRDGEVALGSIWSTRASFVKEDTKGKVDFTFNQGVMVPGVWIVPKGNPAGKEVYRFIASTQDPKRQVEMLLGYGYGPANPAASALVPAELRWKDPLSPENLSRQLRIRSEWYKDNYDKVQPRFLELISS